MDDERLKNGQFFGKDYFKELLERVRSIRVLSKNKCNIRFVSALAKT